MSSDVILRVISQKLSLFYSVSLFQLHYHIIIIHNKQITTQIKSSFYQYRVNSASIPSFDSSRMCSAYLKNVMKTTIISPASHINKTHTRAHVINVQRSCLREIRHGESDFVLHRSHSRTEDKQVNLPNYAAHLSRSALPFC